MLNINLITLDDFEKFLMENLAMEFHSCNVFGCPMSRYLQTRFNDPDIRSGLYRAYKYTYEGEDRKQNEHTLVHYEQKTGTWWMYQFVDLFDGQHQSHDPRTGQEVLDFFRGTFLPRYGYTTASSNSLTSHRDESLVKEDNAQAVGPEVVETLQG
jgi:hypothetical protein